MKEEKSLHQHVYAAYALQAITRKGGRAHVDEIDAEVLRQVRPYLRPHELESLDSGEIRWRKNLRFALTKLKNGGYAVNPVRGYWSLTHDGEEWKTEFTGLAGILLKLDTESEASRFSFLRSEKNLGKSLQLIRDVLTGA